LLKKIYIYRHMALGYRFFCIVSLSLAFLLLCCTQSEHDDENGTFFGSSSCSNPVVSNGSVTCGGQTYRTVNIGGKVWFAENLNYGVLGSKCYNNSSSNCNTYGRLYNWSTAKKVCPSGWHLPSQAEWNVMTVYIGGAGTEGRKLKATSGWVNNGNGTDEYGFSALPGGSSTSDGNFDLVGIAGIWWSAGEYSSNHAYIRSMSYDGDDAEWYGIDKDYLFSLRCVLD